MKAYRAAVLYFSGRQAVLEQDGLLVVGPDESGREIVQAMGSYQAQVHVTRAWPLNTCLAASSPRALLTCTFTIRSWT